MEANQSKQCILPPLDPPSPLLSILPSGYPGNCCHCDNPHQSLLIWVWNAKQTGPDWTSVPKISLLLLVIGAVSSSSASGIRLRQRPYFSRRRVSARERVIRFTSALRSVFDTALLFIVMNTHPASAMNTRGPHQPHALGPYSSVCVCVCTTVAESKKNYLSPNIRQPVLV